MIAHDRTPDPDESAACMEALAITQELIGLGEDPDDEVTGFEHLVEAGELERRPVEPDPLTTWSIMRALGRALRNAVTVPR